MSNDYVKTITTSDGTTYDIRDARLIVTAADAGKVVIVDSSGNLTLSEISGGTKLYKHEVSVGASYEEYKFEFVSTDKTPFTSSTFNYSGLYGKVMYFIPKVYTGANIIVLGYGQRTGPLGELTTIKATDGTIGSYSLSNVNVRNDTVTEL